MLCQWTNDFEIGCKITTYWKYAFLFCFLFSVLFSICLLFSFISVCYREKKQQRDSHRAVATLKFYHEKKTRFALWLWFTEVLVNELYAFWRNDMGVMWYVHFAEFAQYIFVIEPITKASDRNSVFSSEFAFGFGFAVHVIWASS